MTKKVTKQITKKISLAAKPKKSPKPHKPDETFNKLFLYAKKYLDRAYSPYSKVKVAASLLTTDGKVFSGCNIENASYGATNCAERTALFKAVSEGHKKFKAILVITNQNEIWPPCGICRQVMSEFFKPNTVVYLANLKKEFIKKRFSDVFPGSFNKEYLKK